MCSGTGMCPDCMVTGIETKLWNNSTATTKQSPSIPPQAGTIAAKSNQICPRCGQTYEGDKCWECVTRKADIEETFSLCFPVALVGITFGNILAIVIFPPLISHFPKVYMVPAFFFVGAIITVLTLGQCQMRYANYVRLTILLVMISFYAPAAYFFLNGFVDTNPAIQVPSRVISKGVSQGKGGGPYLELSLSWNKVRIKQNIGVSRETLSSVEPGDTVRVVIHPGAFSQPWYDNVLTSSTGTSDLR